MSGAEERRLRLIRWMKESIVHDALTASEIVAESGIYTGQGRADRCFDDLKVLHARGVMDRVGRPARWVIGEVVDGNGFIAYWDTHREPPIASQRPSGGSETAE